MLSGALAYHEKGLYEDALALLHTFIPTPYTWKLDFLLRRSLWEMESMRIQESAQTLSTIQRYLAKLAKSIYQQRLQLTLWRLLNDYGGSYMPSAQKHLIRVQNILRKRADLFQGYSPSDQLVAYNLRSLCAIARGDVQEAVQLYEHIASVQHPQINAHHLNGWLHYLMGRYEGICLWETAQRITPPLNAHETAVFVNRVLLSFVLHATPAFIRRHFGEIERWYRQKGNLLPENRFVWTQLLWLAGDPETAAREMEAVLEHRYVTPLSFFQGRILLNLMYADAGQGRALYSNFRKTLYLLQSRQNHIASARLLMQSIRELYRARFSAPMLRRTSRQWREHLKSHPAEKLLWQLTLLPDWLEARESQKDWSITRRPAPFIDKLFFAAQATLR